MPEETAETVEESPETKIARLEDKVMALGDELGSEKIERTATIEYYAEQKFNRSHYYHGVAGGIAAGLGSSFFPYWSAAAIVGSASGFLASTFKNGDVPGVLNKLKGSHRGAFAGTITSLLIYAASTLGVYHATPERINLLKIGDNQRVTRLHTPEGKRDSTYIETDSNTFVPMEQQMESELSAIVSGAEREVRKKYETITSELDARTAEE